MRLQWRHHSIPLLSMSPIWKELLRLRWRLQKFCQFKGKKYVQYCSTYVTTAFGFFSTAYILTFRPDSSAAVSDALTKGPRPAPTTIITLKRKQTFLNFPLRSIRISLIHLIPGWEQNPRLVFFLQQATTAAGIFLSQKWFYTESTTWKAILDCLFQKDNYCKYNSQTEQG